MFVTIYLETVNKDLFSYNSEGCDSEIKVLAQLVPLDVIFLGLQMSMPSWFSLAAETGLVSV